MLPIKDIIEKKRIVRPLSLPKKIIPLFPEEKKGVWNTNVNENLNKYIDSIRKDH